MGVNFKKFCKSYTLDEILIKNSTYTNTTGIKKKLYESGLKENKCEECGLTEWNNKEISLHLDHINGNNLDNRIENLRILCPNCHSQTETYCNSKNKSKSSEFKLMNFENRVDKSETVKYIPTINVCSCGKEIKNNSKQCVECYRLSNKNNIKKESKKYCSCGKEIDKRSKSCQKCNTQKYRNVKERPNKEELIEMIKKSSLESVGRKYNVSGNAVKKWINN